MPRVGPAVLVVTDAEDVSQECGRMLEDAVRLTFPPGTQLDPGGFLVIARDPAAMQAQYPAVSSILPVGFDGRLGDGSDQIVLKDERGNPADVVDFGAEGRHATRDFFQPVHAERGTCILEPGRFYIFASRERLRVPPDLAAEMLPVDVGIGELRNNYAGFFDNGFGWEEDADGNPTGSGTPAVLEVRAHDMPFLVEDGQVFFRLRYFRASGRPDALYGRGRAGRSYLGQDLTLARAFVPPPRP